MKNNNTVLIKILLSLMLLTFLYVGCSPDVTPSLYSDKDAGLTPVITSLNPTQGLAGVTEITIEGENFSSVAADNFVYFGPLRANILNATSTELKVVAPDLVDDSIQVKIAIAGVEKFSNTELYKLDPAVEEVFPFQSFQQPYSVTTDEFGNLYVSLVEDGVGKGIKKITPDGEMFDYAPIGGGETFFWSMKYKKGGNLYGVRGVFALFEITEGNTSSLYTIFDAGTAMYDLDFDKDGNIWTAGKGGKIYRVNPHKDVKSFDYADNVSAVRIFNDYLYLSSKSDNVQNIVRLPIVSADSLGAPEVYFQFSAIANPGTDIKSFTFAEDGTMFIATSAIAGAENPMNPIMFVNTDGSFGTWYQNLIESFSSTITWGPDYNAYMIRDKFTRVIDEETVTIYPQSVLKLNMERFGAPEYGRD